MNHQRYESWLFDEELLPDQQKELREHLDSCKSCNVLLSAGTLVERRMGSEALAMPDRGFGDRFQARLQLRRKKSHQRQISVILVGSAIAALALSIPLFLQAFSTLLSPDEILLDFVSGVYGIYKWIGFLAGTASTLMGGIANVVPLPVWLISASILGSLVVGWLVTVSRLAYATIQEGFGK
jgi:hypothetical protein